MINRYYLGKDGQMHEVKTLKEKKKYTRLWVREYEVREEMEAEFRGRLEEIMDK